MLRSLAQQRGYFRIRRLEVRRKAMAPQFFRSAGADGENHTGPQSGAQRIRTPHSVGDLKKMDDLNGRGKQDDISVAARDTQDALS